MAGIRFTESRLNSCRFPSEVWQCHKDEIVRLYEKNTLEYVRTKMAEKHNFHPT